MRTKLAILTLLLTIGINISSISAQSDLITLDIDDILDRIAASFDVALDCLEQTNNLDRFQSTGTLTIDGTCPPYEGDLPTTAVFGTGGGVVEYTVQRGDRLADIAEEFDTTVSCIQTANNIDDANLIFPGQSLIITETCDATTALVEPTSTTSGNVADAEGSGECLGDRNAGRVTDGLFYTVQQGDILDFIACDFDVSIVCLIESNSSLQDRQNPALRIGQQLSIDRSCPSWDGPFNSGILNG